MLLCYMQVYPHELEKEFMNFTDFVSSFPLFRGKGLRDEEDESSHVVGYLKVLSTCVHAYIHN